MAYGRRGFFPRTVPSQNSQDPDRNWSAKVDKNPYYRTTDILNGVFKKSIKLIPGKLNSTDGKIITVNFGETRPRKIIGYAGPGSDDGHSNYDLECGHQWEGKSGHPTDSSKWGMCWTCGADQSYLGFEHEWQHIIFKSDLVARALFVDVYGNELLKSAPHVNPIDLKRFLSFLINAFDDIRCNSLWEKIYPGSAQAIWERWKRMTYHMGDQVNKDFMCFVFAVAFGIPTDPNGEFEPMRPIIEWGVQKVKYRGFANMLIDVRAVLDRCMGALLAKIPPPPPKPPQPPNIQPPPPQPTNDSGDNDEATEEEDDSQDEDQQDSQASQSQEPQDQGGPRSQAGDQGQGDSEDEGEDDAQASSGVSNVARSSAGSRPGPVTTPDIQPPSHVPSANNYPASGQQRSSALTKMITNARNIDEKEDHPEPTPADLTDAMGSQALRAMMAQTLGADISDLDALDAKLGDDEPDADMAAALHQLQVGMADKSKDSLLTAQAKALIRVIDVRPQDVEHDPGIELNEDERFAVNRMRSAFFRALGRQKSKRSPDGNVVDVQALIQYRQDHQDPDVFEGEAVQQGFAYSILCDMSGSMAGTFSSVCHAVEMLKQSLKFPFVVGNLWGFRGGTVDGSVWMYRYDKTCIGYTGSTTIKSNYGNYMKLPIECGGLTPMHSAVNVSVTHLWKHLSPGMAKRLFLLTDGSPMHTRVGGGGFSPEYLRQLVAKEINTARQHNIQVYTLIIGSDSIPDDDCKKMFGASRFWKKTERVGQNSVDRVLARLVLENFTKYIKARG